MILLHGVWMRGLTLVPLARRLTLNLGARSYRSTVGEILAPLPVPPVSLVLVNPGVEVSARDAYTWLDAEEAFTPALEVEAGDATIVKTR